MVPLAKHSDRKSICGFRTHDLVGSVDLHIIACLNIKVKYNITIKQKNPYKIRVFLNCSPHKDRTPNSQIYSTPSELSSRKSESPML